MKFQSAKKNMQTPATMISTNSNNSNMNGSSSWTRWMTQSTIHKRSVARQQGKNLERNGYEKQIHLPVTIRVWRHIFTARPMEVNRFGSDNDHDTNDSESISLFHNEQSEGQSWYFSDQFYNDDHDDEIVFTWSINEHASSLTAIRPPHSNILCQSILLAGLVATSSAIFTMAQIRRSVLPKQTIPHFAVPFATLVGNDGLHHHVCAVPIQQILHQRGHFESNRIVSTIHWMKAKSNRILVFIFVLGGYNIASNAILDQRS